MSSIREPAGDCQTANRTVEAMIRSVAVRNEVFWTIVQFPKTLLKDACRMAIILRTALNHGNCLAFEGLSFAYNANERLNQ
jgi:hypothetical protein